MLLTLLSRDAATTVTPTAFLRPSFTDLSIIIEQICMVEK